MFPGYINSPSQQSSILVALYLKVDPSEIFLYSHWLVAWCYHCSSFVYAAILLSFSGCCFPVQYRGCYPIVKVLALYFLLSLYSSIVFFEPEIYGLYCRFINLVWTPHCQLLSSLTICRCLWVSEVSLVRGEHHFPVCMKIYIC